MLDFSHIASQYPTADIQVFVGSDVSNGIGWQTWIKPRGKTMGHLILIGNGGPGGAGVIGANSTAAGGGGGASGSQLILKFPLSAIPDRLFLQLANGAASGTNSFVCLAPDNTTINRFAITTGGAGGTNASGVTPGAGGGAPSATAPSSMPLGAQWMVSAVNGLAGSSGGSNTGSNNVTIPVTGLLVTSGTGGGGLGAAGAAGGWGGAITGGGIFPSTGTPASPSSATVPPPSGDGGYYPVPGTFFGFGGLGGASTHGSATGAGAVQASGGNGAPGCGGGGSGGALTGSTPGVPGKGGPAICIITCW